MTDVIKEIPLDEIKVQKYNVRVHDINVGVEDLAANIKANGLLQPIAAYRDSDTGNYVILTGQRRLNAYHHLNKKYPSQGFDKIKCNIIDEPESDEKKLSLSLAENITQLPMTNPDLIKAVTDLYDKYGEYEIAEEKFGITKSMVNQYVRLSRLPTRIKEAVQAGEISPNPQTAESCAIQAVDATNYTTNGPIKVEIVLQLAKDLANGMMNVGDIRSEMHKGPITEIGKRATNKKKTSLQIRLSSESREKLEKISDSHGDKPNLRATQYVLDGVDKDYNEL